MVQDAGVRYGGPCLTLVSFFSAFFAHLFYPMVTAIPIFHTYFCYLNYTPSINVPQAAVPVNECFILCNALYWIKIHVVFIEICQI